MKTDIEIYTDYVAEARMRLDVIQSFIGKRVTTGVQACDIEFVFLQFRRILELIAFASLAANKDAYSAVRQKFAEEWRAKRILDELEKVNPKFYPAPHDLPQETAPGVKHFPHPSGEYMSKEDFVALYDAASDLMHTRNPFTAKDPNVQITYPVQTWVSRIQRLLWWHVVRLVSGDVWIVNVPLVGNVQAWPAAQMPETN
jgi:hypothetical protein